MIVNNVYHAEDEFTDAQAAKLLRMIFALIPAAHGRLVELLRQLTGRPTYRAGPAVYTFVDRELRPPMGDAVS